MSRAAATTEPLSPALNLVPGHVIVPDALATRRGANRGVSPRPGVPTVTILGALAYRKLTSHGDASGATAQCEPCCGLTATRLHSSG